MVNFILGALTAFFPTFVMWQLYLEKAYVPEEWIDKEESSGKYWTSIAVQTAAMVLVGFLSFANGPFS